MGNTPPSVGTIVFMKPRYDVCRTCSDLIEAAENILEEQTAGDSGSAEEWFYCPNCWFAMVSLHKQSFEAQCLEQRLKSASKTDSSSLLDLTS